MKTELYEVVRIEDDSTDIDFIPGKLYLIGKDEPYIGIFVCPCGCGELTHLNFIKDTNCWTVDIKDGKATISPSILRTIGCRSHFFIQNGKVVWA